MPPTTSWKRFAEEVEIGLGLGVVRVKFNREDFWLGWVEFNKEVFCLFGLDGLIFTRGMAQRRGQAYK